MVHRIFFGKDSSAVHRFFFGTSWLKSAPDACQSVLLLTGVGDRMSATWWLPTTQAMAHMPHPQPGTFLKKLFCCTAWRSAYFELGSTPKALRTHVLWFLDPKTMLCRAFGLF